MEKITLDAAVAAKLSELGCVVQLCDPSGRVVGRFVPFIDLSEWPPVTPDVSEEELDEIENSDMWYTTEEVLEHLRKLENS